MRITAQMRDRKKKDTPYRPQWHQLLKAARTDLGESQKKFGERLGVTESAISRWEAGKRDMPSEITWWLHKGVLAGRK